MNFDVAAMNALSENLPQAQFIKVEAFRKAQLQIEKAVVDALHADADGPAILFGASLGVAGHGETFAGFFCQHFFW